MIVSTIRNKDDFLLFCHAIFDIFLSTFMNLGLASTPLKLVSLSRQPHPTPFCFSQKHKEYEHLHIGQEYDLSHRLVKHQLPKWWFPCFPFWWPWQHPWLLFLNLFICWDVWWVWGSFLWESRWQADWQWVSCKSFRFVILPCWWLILYRLKFYKYQWRLRVKSANIILTVRKFTRNKFLFG